MVTTPSVITLSAASPTSNGRPGTSPAATRPADGALMSLKVASPASASRPTTPASAAAAKLGEGVELLMNDKRKATPGSSPTTPRPSVTRDLSTLEAELNNLSGDSGTPTVLPSAVAGAPAADKISILHTVKTDAPKQVDAARVDARADAGATKATWDGFKSVTSTPVDPDAAVVEPPKSKSELMREKFEILQKLRDVERKGAKLSRRYDMECDLAEMTGEYESIVCAKEKSNSAKFQGKMLMAAITGLEFLNNKFDPFDVKLDGWAEQVSENMTDYDDIFGELHDKYKSKASLAPEVKLMFQIAGSAVMVHMTNTMFKSAVPNVDDIMRQNPELMQQFTRAAVDSMGTTHPGFTGFMGDVGMPGAGRTPAMPMGAQTAGAPHPRPGARQAPTIAEHRAPPVRTAPVGRTPMRGPPAPAQGDKTDLLSGIKPKSKAAPTPQGDDGSTVSLKELKSMADSSRSTARPGKRRAPTTISLNL